MTNSKTKGLYLELWNWNTEWNISLTRNPKSWRIGRWWFSFSLSDFMWFLSFMWIFRGAGFYCKITLPEAPPHLTQGMRKHHQRHKSNLPQQWCFRWGQFKHPFITVLYLIHANQRNNQLHRWNLRWFVEWTELWFDWWWRWRGDYHVTYHITYLVL